MSKKEQHDGCQNPKGCRSRCTLQQSETTWILEHFVKFRRRGCASFYRPEAQTLSVRERAQMQKCENCTRILIKSFIRRATPNIMVDDRIRKDVCSRCTLQQSKTHVYASISYKFVAAGARLSIDLTHKLYQCLSARRCRNIRNAQGFSSKVCGAVQPRAGIFSNSCIRHADHFVHRRHAPF